MDFSEIIECKNESVKELIEIIKAYSDNYSDKQICISEKVLNSFNGQDRTKLVHIVFDYNLLVINKRKLRFIENFKSRNGLISFVFYR